jgi:hypothetical protein
VEGGRTDLCSLELDDFALAAVEVWDHLDHPSRVDIGNLRSQRRQSAPARFDSARLRARASPPRERADVHASLLPYS